MQLPYSNTSRINRLTPDTSQEEELLTFTNQPMATNFHPAPQIQSQQQLDLGNVAVRTRNPDMNTPYNVSANNRIRSRQGHHVTNNQVSYMEHHQTEYPRQVVRYQNRLQATAFNPVPQQTNHSLAPPDHPGIVTTHTPHQTQYQTINHSNQKPATFLSHKQCPSYGLWIYNRTQPVKVSSKL
jgi:hypothetical protein